MRSLVRNLKKNAGNFSALVRSKKLVHVDAKNLALFTQKFGVEKNEHTPSFQNS